MIEFSKSAARLLKPASVVVALGLVATVANGQSVTIDFTRTRGNPMNIPWSEDGFTVTTPTPAEFPKPSGVSVIAESINPEEPIPLPPSGLLQFQSGGSGYPLVTAFLTNNFHQPFDLLSLDFHSFTGGLFTTNFARVYSSAGGSFDLLDTPNETTLTFNGAAWRNLSFVAVDFYSEGALSSQLLLDNFVVQVNAVPEPSSLHIALLLISALFPLKSAWRGVRC
jgi:hypothetical protein